MGLFGRKRAKNEAAAAVEAWKAEVSAGLPAAQVSADTWTGPFVPAHLAATTYTVSIPGSRSELATVVGRLSGPIQALGAADTLDLRVVESPAPGAAYSSLVLSGEKRDRDWLHSLVRTHDSLVERVPGMSVLIGGLNGRCTVLNVARVDAVSTARLLISWWEEQLTGEHGGREPFGLSLEIGGKGDDPDISYTVELAWPIDAEELDAGLSAAVLPGQDQRQQIQRAAAAWTASLEDLDAAAKVELPAGFAAELGFRLPAFEPRLVVLERSTGVWNTTETANLAAAMRLRNPASGVQM